MKVKTGPSSWDLLRSTLHTTRQCLRSHMFFHDVPLHPCTSVPAGVGEPDQPAGGYDGAHYGDTRFICCCARPGVRGLILRADEQYSGTLQRLTAPPPSNNLRQVANAPLHQQCHGMRRLRCSLGLLGLHKLPSAPRPDFGRGSKAMLYLEAGLRQRIGTSGPGSGCGSGSVHEYSVPQ